MTTENTAKFFGLFLILMIFAISTLDSSVFAQTTRTECFVRGARVVSEDYDPAARRGVVVLSHPEVGEVEGVSLAPADRFPIQMQAQLMALEAAKAVAYGKIAERLCGVSVSK